MTTPEPLPLRRPFEETAATADTEGMPTVPVADGSNVVQDGRAGERRSAGLPRIAGYDVLGVLGEGGMGVVFEAEQQSPRRRVALKVIRGGALADDTRIRMFQREADTLARLKHPNIGVIYGCGRTETGEPFFAMELVRGKTLGAFLRGRNHREGVSVAEVRLRLDLFRRIATAVHYAHQRGVIHRDLKPSNICVMDESSEHEIDVKILDFGLARITDADVQASMVSEVGVIKGTLAYMSPEQARGVPDEIDVRSDVYSLGVILYEMLSGRLPKEIPSGSMLEALRVITQDAPRPLREAFGGSKRLDPDVLTVCHKALQLVPDDRYGSAAAMADDVERYLTDQPIQARPPSAAYQLRKLVARNKLLTVFAGTVVIVLVGVAVTMSVLRNTAERVRADAQARARELELVTEFQSSMLSGIDAAEMGRGLVSDLRDGVRKSLEEEGVSSAELTGTLGAFDRTLSRANATDVALALIDEQVLRRAVGAVEAQFSEQPLVRAALQQTVAIAYREIGLYPQAMPLQEAALVTRRRVLGDDHPQTLGSINDMGLLLKTSGEFDAALGFYREALERRRRVLGDAHPQTLNSINNMGLLLQEMGKQEEALASLREALEGRQRVLGDDHAETLSSLNNMGFFLESTDRLDESLVYYTKALEGRRRVLGNDHVETLQSLNNMGLLLQSMGRGEEGLVHLREALEGRRRVLGNDNPQTVESINNVGAGLKGMGRFDEALDYFQESLEGFRRRLGDDHPNTLIARNNMGVLLQSMGRHDEALVCCREAFEGSRRVLGDDHPSTLVFRSKVGELLQSMGKLDEAETHLSQALTGFRRVLGDEHTSTLLSINRMGALLIERGNAHEAADLMSPAEAPARKAFTGDNVRRLGLFLTSLGQARAAIGSFDMAEANLSEAVVILRDAPGATRKDQEKPLICLVQLYGARDKAEPGEGWSRKADEWQSRLRELQGVSGSTLVAR